nr:MAG TPA: hypothetical protein [Caudoviricetes sp.]
MNCQSFCQSISAKQSFFCFGTLFAMSLTVRLQNRRVTINIIMYN